MARRKRQNIIQLNTEQLLAVFEREKRPLAIAELRATLQCTDTQTSELKKIIKDLLTRGALIRLKNKRYGLPGRMNLQAGTLWCTKSGNAFVIPDDTGERDIFIPARSVKDAIHGDKVVARIEHSHRGRKEGSIIKVTERSTKNIAGFIKKHRDTFYLVSEDERISRRFIVEKYPKNSILEENGLAVARIVRYPEGGNDPSCEIIKVFKDLSNVGSIIEFTKNKYGYPRKFHRSVEEELKGADHTVSANDRIDLRALLHVTIDGEFAKDFDDAVCIVNNSNGFTLYVSIADASSYVPAGSPTDREAYQRGTSVYFPGTVIPMLPELLSNELCSLNPGHDRYALTARLDYDNKGVLHGSSFFPSVINSKKRLTYTQVENLLVNKDGATKKQLKGFIRHLEQMGRLASLLREKRIKRGALDFDLPEPEVILDIEGGIQEILRAKQLFSHQIIEEFMVAANEAVARFLAEKKIPQMYRVHEPPEKEKLRDFEALIRILPIKKTKGGTDGRSLQSVLVNARDSDFEFLINRVLLKSMKQARYTAYNKGHFGLASDAYVHFTSPIRRYPDLVCHRILYGALNNKRVYNEQELEQMAIHLSERERLAMETEREIEDRIRILYMKDRVGEDFDGIISHITSFGFFVELIDIFVEGVVLLTELYDDYYVFQEEKFRLIGRRTRRSFRIGDKVRVRVATANPEKKQLHFVLLDSKNK